MRQFLHDYADTLDTIGQACNASTLYSLVKIYEFLAAAEPEFVFDQVSGLLVGPATKEGFHHESLASEAVVRLIRRYLADHRPFFDDEERRLRLVEVMEAFAKAGWPDALKLLYELPDLLR